MDEEAIKKIENSKLTEIALFNTLNSDKHYSEKIVKLSVSTVISKYLEELVQNDIKHH